MMFSGFAYANLCVSEAMKKDLKRTLGIQYELLLLICYVANKRAFVNTYPSPVLLSCMIVLLEGLSLLQ